MDHRMRHTRRDGGSYQKTFWRGGRRKISHSEPSFTQATGFGNR
jgi:hypothetical protein